MRWRGRRTSGNVEDRRGMGGRAGGIGGIGLVIVLLIGLVFGIDVSALLDPQGASLRDPPPTASGPNAIDDETEEFVAVVLADTEEVWASIFAASGLDYDPPVLVLYSGVTRSACGGADAAMGPFYCPNDRRVFLDTDFFRVMEDRLGARGEFARAYVIAHEVAHHVQAELGLLARVHTARARVGREEANALSVRTELQADCYAGLWARHAEERWGILERGDIEAALEAAAAIGDDALQRASRGVVVPDSFTHGSSAQRQRWFYRGFETGDPQSCDTFAAETL
jgi:uncharacterized protein